MTETRYDISEFIKNLSECIESNSNISLSGGAEGSDHLFGLWASVNSHEQIHFSFKEHKFHVPDNHIMDIPNYILSDTYIQQKLSTANRSMERNVPKKGTYVNKLLARNYLQIYCTERVYAMIEGFESPSRVMGGTGWAVQMFLDRDVKHEIYVYNIYDQKAYSYSDELMQFVEVQDVPTPHGIWTGIGTRKADNTDMALFVEKFK